MIKIIYQVFVISILSCTLLTQSFAQISPATPNSNTTATNNADATAARVFATTARTEATAVRMSATAVRTEAIAIRADATTARADATAARAEAMAASIRGIAAAAVEARAEATIARANATAKVGTKEAQTAEDKAKAAEEKAKAAEEKANIQTDAKVARAEATTVRAEATSARADAIITRKEATIARATAVAKIGTPEAKDADDKAKAAEDKAKTAEDTAKAAEDKAKTAEDKAKIAEDKAKIATDKEKTTEDKAKKAEDKAKKAEDKAKTAEDKAKAAEDKAKAAEDKAKAAEDKAKAAEEKAKDPAAAAAAASSAPEAATSAPTTTISTKKESSSMINSVTMVAVGLIASRLYKYTKPIDVIIAAAAGAIFIYSELKSTQKINDETLNIAKKSDGSYDNMQVDSLKKLKSSLVAVKEGVQTKKSIQTAAAVAFGAATAAALVVSTSVASTEAACLAATSAVSATCSATPCPAPLQRPVAPLAKSISIADEMRQTEANVLAPSQVQATKSEAQIAARTGSLATLSSTVTATSNVCMEAATTCGAAGCVAPAQAGVTACNSAFAAQKTACSAFLTIEKASHAVGNPSTLAALNNENKIKQPFYEQLFSYVIPSAKANNTTLLFGAAGVAAGLILTETLGATVDTWMFTPTKRAAIWGVLAGLSYMAVKGSESTISDLEENISKIDAILSKMKNGGLAGSAGQSSAANKQTPVTNSNGQQAVGGTVGNSTFGSSSSGAPGSFLSSTPDGSNIQCALGNGNTNCASVKNALVTSPQWKSLTPDLREAGLNIGNLVNKVQGKPGVMNEVMGSFSAINGLSLPIQSAIRAGQYSLNGKLNKMGKRGIDFTNGEEHLLQRLNQKSTDALKKSGTTPGEFLASIGSSLRTENAPNKNAQPPKKAMGLFSNDVPYGETSSVPWTESDKSKNAAETQPEVAQTETTEDTYQMGKGEITTDDSASIFSIISERYMKSAVPKLLEKDPPKN